MPALVDTMVHHAAVLTRPLCIVSGKIQMPLDFLGWRFLKRLRLLHDSMDADVERNAFIDPLVQIGKECVDPRPDIRFAELLPRFLQPLVIEVHQCDEPVALRIYQ